MTAISGTAAEPGREALAQKGLAARLAGVLVAPRATYAAVAARPRWLGAVTFVLLFGAVCTYIFLSTEVGQNALLDQQVRTLESFGMTIPDQAYAQMEARIGQARYTGGIFQAVVFILAGLAVAGLALAVFNAIIGGDATFKQVFAVVAHSGVVMSASQAFGMPLAYARESMSGATNLAVFTPFLDEGSFAARVLGSIDLFLIWWMVSLAIGFGVLYRKRTTPIATTLIAIYVAIGVAVAAIKTAVAGT